MSDNRASALVMKGLYENTELDAYIDANSLNVNAELTDQNRSSEKQLGKSKDLSDLSNLTMESRTADLSACVGDDEETRACDESNELEYNGMEMLKDVNGKWKVEELLNYMEKLKGQFDSTVTWNDSYKLMQVEIKQQNENRELAKEIQLEEARKLELTIKSTEEVKKKNEELRFEYQEIALENQNDENDIAKLEEEQEYLKAQYVIAKEKETAAEEIAQVRLADIEILYEENNEMTDMLKVMARKFKKVKNYVAEAKSVLTSKLKFWKSSTKNRKTRAADIMYAIISESPSL